MDGTDDMFRNMASYWFEQWYIKDVSPNLSYEDKMRLMHRISELSMREPIFEGHLYYPKEDFPELAPYVSPGTGGTHAYTGKKGDISGVQLYSVLMMLGKDLGMPTTRASMITSRGTHGPILPDLPLDTKRMRERAEYVPAERLTELSDVGTDLVPNVANKAGCSLIKGKWLPDKNICLLKDTPAEGWTAPIKGAYIYWSRSTPRQKLKSSYPENELFYKDVPGKSNMISACHVYGDDYYPKGMGTCKSPVYSHFIQNRDPRAAALELASDIAKGRAGSYDLQYLNKTGNRISPAAKDAIIAPKEKQSLVQLYRELSFSKSSPPFRIKVGV
jgi:hypothetical protein